MAFTTPTAAGQTTTQGGVDYISAETAVGSGVFVWIIKQADSVAGGTSTTAGILQLATPAEVTTGTDTAKAATAEGVKAAVDAKNAAATPTAAITGIAAGAASNTQTVLEELAAKAIANESISGQNVGTVATNAALEAITDGADGTTALESGDFAYFNPATSPATDNAQSRVRGIYVYNGTAWPTTPSLELADSVGAASDTAAGIVELLTDTEALAGTDTVRAATAANLAAVEPSLSATNTHVVTVDRKIAADQSLDLRIPTVTSLPADDSAYRSVIYIGTTLPNGLYCHNGTTWFQS